MKKIISLLLAVVMIVGLMPSVFASPSPEIPSSAVDYITETIDPQKDNAVQLAVTLSGLEPGSEYEYSVKLTVKDREEEVISGYSTLFDAETESTGLAIELPILAEMYAGKELVITERMKKDNEVVFEKTNADIIVTVQELGPDPCADFEDINRRSWYHQGVDFAIENGLFNGISKTKFAPDADMTRAMFVTVLYRLDGSPKTKTPVNLFKDVNQKSYYANAVAWAVENKITAGVSETSFAPDKNITREEAATFMLRYYKYLYNKPHNVNGNDVAYGGPIKIPVIGLDFFDKYEDKNQISRFAREPMGWAVYHGIINGVTETELAPKDTATRAQIATILMRFVGFLNPSEK